MKRAPSALLAIGGFGVAVAILSVVTTAAIVLFTPQPEPVRTSATEAIAALEAETPGFERRQSPSPPQGRRVLVLEQMMATSLGRPPADLRVIWLDGVGQGAPGSTLPTGKLELGHQDTQVAPGSIIMIQRQIGTPVGSAPPGAMLLGRSPFMSIPLPAFSTSLRQGDGQWLTVEPARPVLGRWQVTILLSLAISLLLLAPLAWFFARRLTRPFRALAGALDTSAETLPQEGPRELRDAAAAITAMRRRLSAEASERVRLLTAIAHDLRTPLTGLRLRVEAAPQPQRERMVCDIERMQAMIEEVLTFARNEVASPVRLEARALLAEIVADAQAAGGAADCEQGGSVSLAEADEAWIQVRPLAFRRAIENLVRNAIDYAGSCRVELSSTGGGVQISVIDAGKGIAEGDRKRLLLPFERGEASRNRGTGGTGLGLSIVQDFATGHGGTLTLEDAPGGGTVATVRLPQA